MVSGSPAAFTTSIRQYATGPLTAVDACPELAGSTREYGPHLLLSHAHSDLSKVDIVPAEAAFTLAVLTSLESWQSRWTKAFASSIFVDPSTLGKPTSSSQQASASSCFIGSLLTSPSPNEQRE